MKLMEVNTKKHKIDRRAEKKAQMLLALGSLIMVGQFAFITSGTFVFYSWDIMEPIAYIMMFTNFTTAFLYFNMKKRSMELSNLKGILSERFALKKYKRNGINIKEIQQCEKEIMELKDLLRKSIS